VYLFQVASANARPSTQCSSVLGHVINIGFLIGNHTFLATGITQYLPNEGRRALAPQMAEHESPRTTALYDRRDDEVERILI
jgi:hypothetical protein